MSIYNDIEKATQISCTNENASFVRVKHKKKRNRHHSVENENLYEDNADDSNDTVTTTEWGMNEVELACTINEANDGISYSNDNLEDHWKSRQFDNHPICSNTLLKSSSTSPVTDDDLKVDLKRDNNLGYKEEALKKCQLSKNAAIAGLLKCNRISVQDLQIPHNSNSDDEDPDKYRMKLVQYQEDPDVFLQPLQAHGKIDENKYKEIDFTVPHIGKKTITTPRQYYLHEDDDSYFQFKKKDAKCKK